MVGVTALAQLAQPPNVTMVAPAQERRGINALVLPPSDTLPIAFGPDRMHRLQTLAQERASPYASTGHRVQPST
jgi:hypothetical protein